MNNPFDLRIKQIRRKPREPSILVVCDPERKEIQIPCRLNELVGGEIKQKKYVQKQKHNARNKLKKKECVRSSVARYLERAEM